MQISGRGGRQPALPFLPHLHGLLLTDCRAIVSRRLTSASAISDIEGALDAPAQQQAMVGAGGSVGAVATPPAATVNQTVAVCSVGRFSAEQLEAMPPRARGEILESRAHLITGLIDGWTALQVAPTHAPCVGVVFPTSPAPCLGVVFPSPATPPPRLARCTRAAGVGDRRKVCS